MTSRLRINIVIGSTRPGGKAASVSRWAHGIAGQRRDAEYGLLDIEAFRLPLLDEPAPAMTLDPSSSLVEQYTKDHTRAWSDAVASFDGYVFVTPEYNHGASGALKNAIDFLYHEWGGKAAGFVGYGNTMGARAIESLRPTLAAKQVATVRPQLGLSLHKDFRDGAIFEPTERHRQGLENLLDDVVAWSAALRSVREPSTNFFNTTMGAAS
jgi:NAD(P)H-dependent FMN reductase